MFSAGVASIFDTFKNEKNASESDDESAHDKSANVKRDESESENNTSDSDKDASESEDDKKSDKCDDKSKRDKRDDKSQDSTRITATTNASKCVKRMRDRMFSCTMCSFKRQFRSAVLKHVNGVHLNIRPYKCKYCKKSFPDKHKLKHHQRVHSEDADFTCTLCDAVFKYANGLTSHLQTKHTSDEDKAFLCSHPNCDLRFWFKSDLNKHAKIHLNIREYECRGCFRRFTRASTLKKHEESTTACDRAVVDQRHVRKRKLINDNDEDDTNINATSDIVPTLYEFMSRDHLNLKTNASKKRRFDIQSLDTE